MADYPLFSEDQCCIYPQSCLQLSCQNLSLRYERCERSWSETIYLEQSSLLLKIRRFLLLEAEVLLLMACREWGCWDIFRKKLKNGADLETVLLGVTFTPEMLIDVKCETWNLISSKDLELFDRILFDNEKLPLSQLIRKFRQTDRQKVDIITTNYDRVIEYACDSVGIPVSTGFRDATKKDLQVYSHREIPSTF